MVHTLQLIAFCCLYWGIVCREMPVFSVDIDCQEGENVCVIEFKTSVRYAFTREYPDLKRIKLQRFQNSVLDIAKTPNLERVTIISKSGLPQLICKVIIAENHCLTLDVDGEETQCCLSTRITDTPAATSTSADPTKDSASNDSTTKHTTTNDSTTKDTTTKDESSTEPYIIYISTSIMIIIITIIILMKLRKRCRRRHIQHDIESPIELPRCDYSFSEKTIFDQSACKSAKNE